MSFEDEHGLGDKHPRKKSFVRKLDNGGYEGDIKKSFAHHGKSSKHSYGAYAGMSKSQSDKLMDSKQKALHAKMGKKTGKAHPIFEHMFSDIKKGKYG